MIKWPTIKLGSVADFKNGLNYSKENFGKGMKVIGISNFQNYNTPKYSELDEINPQGIVRDRDTLIDGDILFVRSNGNRDLIGRCLLISNPPEKISHSGFTIRLRFDSDIVCNKFYLYFFKSPILRSIFSLYGGGTNINNLNQGILSNLDVPLPPLPTQKKIAAVLSAYDDLIENNTRRIALLERMAEELYKEWFVRMRFPGHESVHFEKGVPEGWRIDAIDSVSKKIVTGKTPPTKVSSYYNGDIHFIKTPDMHGNLFILDTQEKVTVEGLNSNKSQIIPADSICVSCIGTGGIVSITTENCQTNQQINSVLPKNSFYLEWLYQTIKTQKETISLFGGTGTTMTNLSKGKFSKIKIFIPTDDLILQYHQQINPIFKKHKILLKQINILKTTRDRLLTRLISGKLSVKDLDIAFPPSMQDKQPSKAERLSLPLETVSS